MEAVVAVGAEAGAEDADGDDTGDVENVAGGDEGDEGGDDDVAAMLASRGEDDAEVFLVLSAGKDEDEEAALLQKKLKLPLVCVFDEKVADGTVERSSMSIHFFAMSQSLQTGTLLLPSVAASLLTMALQIMLLHGFLFAYYLGPTSMGTYNTFSKILGKSDAAGGLPASIAHVAALFFSPVILIAKLSKNNEFAQTPTFRATLRALARAEAHARPDSKLTILCHYYFWSLLYVLRSSLVIAYMTFCNAVITANEGSVRMVCVLVLVLLFLLDWDDYIYSALFVSRSRTGSPQKSGYTKVRLGAATAAACEEIRSKTTSLVAGVQPCLMVLALVWPSQYLLWAVPLVMLLVAGCTGTTFPPYALPTVASRLVGLEAMVGLVALLWVWLMRCTLLPECGEGLLEIVGLDG